MKNITERLRAEAALAYFARPYSEAIRREQDAMKREAGRSPNQLISAMKDDASTPDAGGKTALHRAVIAKNADVVIWLYATLMVDMLARDNAGCLASDYALPGETCESHSQSPVYTPRLDVNGKPLKYANGQVIQDVTGYEATTSHIDLHAVLKHYEEQQQQRNALNERARVEQALRLLLTSPHVTDGFKAAAHFEIRLLHQLDVAALMAAGQVRAASVSAPATPSAHHVERPEIQVLSASMPRGDEKTRR